MSIAADGRAECQLCEQVQRRAAVDIPDTIHVSYTVQFVWEAPPDMGAHARQQLLRAVAVMIVWHTVEERPGPSVTGRGPAAHELVHRFVQDSLAIAADTAGRGL